MTVLDNIKLGRHAQLTTGLLDALVYFGKARREEMALREEIERRIIDFLEIDHIRKAPVAALPYGLQKRVELGRALAMQPRLLMLDEPVAGMNREETEDMARFILDVQAEWDVTVLMVEHDMGLVMDISDHIVVLNFGELIANGPPEEVQRNPEVIKAYLGSGDFAALRQRIDRRRGGAAGRRLMDWLLLEVSPAGLGTGGLYALTALAFVIIYKATGVFSFAGVNIHAAIGDYVKIVNEQGGDCAPEGALCL